MIHKNVNAAYKQVIRDVLSGGEIVSVRGVRRLSLLSGTQIKIDISEHFPLIGLKQTWMHGITTELLWFLRGETSLEYLHKHDVHIWDENAGKDGNLGPIYGKQWRDFGGIDQIERLEDGLRKLPKSTRNVVTAWNPCDMSDMLLPPCHWGFQCTSNGEEMDMIVSMRSSDVGIGLPFNIASYALLANIVALRAGLRQRILTMQLGHTHMYESHVNPLSSLLSRSMVNKTTLVINGDICMPFEQMSPDMFSVNNYKSFGKMRLELYV